MGESGRFSMTIVTCSVRRRGMSWILICIILNFVCCRTATVAANAGQEGKDNPPMQELMSAHEAFSLRLYASITKGRNGLNTVVSPFGIGVALSIACNGATGETRKAITEALCTGGMDLEGLNRLYRSLISDLRQSDHAAQTELVNSLWLHSDKKFKADFQDRIGNYYGAETRSVDLRSPETIEKINRWVREKTAGKITEIADPSFLRSIFVIINAIYFRAPWHATFRPDMTKDKIFTLSNGAAATVSMMFCEGTWQYHEEEAFKAVCLPYKDKRVSMYVFLPKEGTNLPQFHELLTRENWKKWLAGFRERRGNIGLPRFRQVFDIDLVSALGDIAMREACDPARARFDDMVSTPGTVFLGTVKHKTFLEVNEQGTEAAAVTGLAAKEEIPLETSFTMIVNRPFFLAIRDGGTGTILFMASLFDPGYYNTKVLSEDDVARIVDSVVRHDVKPGNRIGGSGHHSFVSYAVDEIANHDIYWGVADTADVVRAVEEHLTSEGIAVVRLDKNFPTSINSDEFETNMRTISAQIRVSHQLEFSGLGAFKAYFTKKNE